MSRNMDEDISGNESFWKNDWYGHVTNKNPFPDGSVMKITYLVKPSLLTIAVHIFVD